jgi:hypothetical protein
VKEHSSWFWILLGGDSEMEDASFGVFVGFGGWGVRGIVIFYYVLLIDGRKEENEEEDEEWNYGVYLGENSRSQAVPKHFCWWILQQFKGQQE